MYDKVYVTVNDEKREAAFININRTVILSDAIRIKSIIDKRGYNENEAIQVMKGEEVIKEKAISLCDLNRNPIAPENASDYFGVVDGQHRTIAVSKYNEEHKEDTLTVPAKLVKLKDQPLVEYIRDINSTKKNWELKDYIKNASLVNSEEPFLKRYNELLRTVENPTGYPLTTLNLIFTGKGSSLKRADFLLLCEGKTEKGKKGMIPERHYLDIGNRFIDTCKKVGFNDKDIAKRYLITEFNEIASREGAEKALKIFESISQNEKEAMLNDRKSLNEDQVIEVFKEKTKDLWKESETSNEDKD